MNRKEILNWYKEEFESISNGIKNKNSLNYLDFLRIRNFKLQNSSRAEEKEIFEITKRAFEFAKNDQIKEAISVLKENLNGVAIPIASTILAMRFPEKYAIIDVNVINQLGKIEWLEKYKEDLEIYEKYLLLMRENAKNENKTLRDYERGLFEAEAKKGEIKLKKK